MRDLGFRVILGLGPTLTEVTETRAIAEHQHHAFVLVVASCPATVPI